MGSGNNVLSQDLHKKRCLLHFFPLRTICLLPQYRQMVMETDSASTMLRANVRSLSTAASESFIQLINWVVMGFSFIIDLRNTMMIQA